MHSAIFSAKNKKAASPQTARTNTVYHEPPYFVKITWAFILIFYVFT